MVYVQVSIEHTADWWLGNLDDPWFRALEDAVRDEWTAEPLRIREGGVSLDSFGCSPLGLRLSLDAVHTIDPISGERICVPCATPSTWAKHGM